MTFQNWRSFLETCNQELLSNSRIRASLPEVVQKNGWLGFPGASEEKIIELENRLGLKLRLTFGNGEKILSNWMSENAYVTWLVRDEPWLFEDQLIKMLSLPLNLKGNESHPFHPILTKIRSQWRHQALTN